MIYPIYSMGKMTEDDDGGGGGGILGQIYLTSFVNGSLAN